jgi:hypothetical protein
MTKQIIKLRLDPNIVVAIDELSRALGTTREAVVAGSIMGMMTTAPSSEIKPGGTATLDVDLGVKRLSGAASHPITGRQ